MIVDCQLKTKEEKERVSEARTVDNVSLKSHRREANIRPQSEFCGRVNVAAKR